METQGYRVLPASSAAEGIEIFKHYGDEIKLLVSDLVMPGMGGGQLAKELRQLRPSLKVLFISGYTEEICVQQGVMTSMESFLAKPFKLRHWLAKFARYSTTSMFVILLVSRSDMALRRARPGGSTTDSYTRPTRPPPLFDRTAFNCGSALLGELANRSLAASCLAEKEHLL